jgi:hypothetical protein
MDKNRNKFYVQKCRSKQTKQQRTEQYRRTAFGSMFSFIGVKTSSAIAEDKLKNRQSNIDRNYVRNLYALNNKCAISNIDLTFCRALTDLSIDRIDNSIGHTINNIQLICKGLNLLKNNGNNEDVLFFIDCLKNIKEFVPGIKSRDYVSLCVRNAIKTDLKNNLLSDINTDFIYDLANRQNWRCYFTGLKFAVYKHPIFSLSIDRIDNSIGHIKDNIRLVLKGINRARGNYSDNLMFEFLNDIKQNK